MRIQQGVSSLKAFAVTIIISGMALNLACGPKGPTPQDVLSRYLEAVGGEAAIQGVTSQVAEGDFSIPDMGYDGTFKQVMVVPDNLRMSILIDGSEMAASGVTDGLAWDLNPMSGARLLQDSEKRIALRGVSVDPVWAWRETFSSATFQNTSEEGPNADILLRTAEGDQIICSFSKETGLLDRTILFLGNNRISQKYSDYREVSGLKMPYKIESDMGGLKLGFQMKSIELNVPVEDAAFVLPEQIQKLVKQ